MTPIFEIEQQSNSRGDSQWLVRINGIPAIFELRGEFSWMDGDELQSTHFQSLEDAVKIAVLCRDISIKREASRFTTVSLMPLADLMAGK